MSKFWDGFTSFFNNETMGAFVALVLVIGAAIFVGLALMPYVSKRMEKV